MNQIKESKYKSHQTEKLGKTLDRNYILPEKVKTKNFAYGNPTAFNDYIAKDVIAPNDFQIENTKEILELYKNTHGNYEAGE